MASPDLPFSSAKDAVDEACGWLQDYLATAGEKGDCFEDCQQAAIDCLDKAASLLSDSGFEVMETGEHDPVNCTQCVEQCVIDPQAAAAARTMERMVQLVQALTNPEGIPAVVEVLQQYFATHHAERLHAERQYRDAMDDACPY